jgi:hypothetical protein
MNDTLKSTMRAILPLLKGRIVAKDSTCFKIAIGGSTTITVTPPNMSLYDIHDGDILTLYTEVLYAKPFSPPIQ